MTVNVSDANLASYAQCNSIAEQLVALEDHFEKTNVYQEFRHRVFSVLAQREARLRTGKSELKGAALIGPAGAGKSRIAAEIIAEHHALSAAAGDRQFGSRILSVIVPGRRCHRNGDRSYRRVSRSWRQRNGHGAFRQCVSVADGLR